MGCVTAAARGGEIWRHDPPLATPLLVRAAQLRANAGAGSTRSARTTSTTRRRRHHAVCSDALPAVPIAGSTQTSAAASLPTIVDTSSPWVPKVHARAALERSDNHSEYCASGSRGTGMAPTATPVVAGGATASSRAPQLALFRVSAPPSPPHPPLQPAAPPATISASLEVPIWPHAAPRHCHSGPLL